MIPGELSVESKSPIVVNITEYQVMNRLNRLIHPASSSLAHCVGFLRYFLSFGLLFSFRQVHLLSSWAQSPRSMALA